MIMYGCVYLCMAMYDYVFVYGYVLLFMDMYIRSFSITLNTGVDSDGRQRRKSI